ncbi:MAG: hypothetical protein ACE5F8_03840 [Woeseiaceae bacterium]
MNASAEALQAEQPPLNRSGLLLGICTVVFLAAIVSLVLALSGDGIDYPSFAASWLYLMGITQAGVVFTAIMRLVGADWSKPYHRVAELSTLAFFPIAAGGLFVVGYFGRDELFYWLHPGEHAHMSSWLDYNWLIVRNCTGMLLFYSMSAYYVVKAMQPDLESLSDDQLEHREQRLEVLGTLVIVTFVIANTFVAWDFGMMLIEHWHSTVFPIFFSFGNLFAGTAALIMLPVVFGRTETRGSPFGLKQIRSLGMVVTGFTLMWLYFFWAQFFVTWFGNLPHESAPLWKQMYGHYAPYFWTMMAACFFVPFVAFIFAFVKRSLLAMFIVAAGINSGIWLNKYLTVATTFSENDRPFDSWLDILLALGMLAGFLAVLLLLMRRFPVYARWEMARRVD